MNLAFSEEAAADLLRLRNFIAGNDPSAANRVGAQLVERIEHLLQFPHLGRPVGLAPDPESLRDLVFGNTIVRYSIHSETVIIHRLWHHLEDRET